MNDEMIIFIIILLSIIISFLLTTPVATTAADGAPKSTSITVLGLDVAITGTKNERKIDVTT